MNMSKITAILLLFVMVSSVHSQGPPKDCTCNTPNTGRGCVDRGCSDQIDSS